MEAKFRTPSFEGADEFPDAAGIRTLIFPSEYELWHLEALTSQCSWSFASTYDQYVLASTTSHCIVIISDLPQFERCLKSQNIPDNSVLRPSPSFPHAFERNQVHDLSNLLRIFLHLHHPVFFSSRLFRMSLIRRAPFTAR